LSLAEQIQKLPEGPQRDKAEELLREISRTVAENPLEGVRFEKNGKKHWKQIRFLENQSPLKAFFGGNGAAKSFSGYLDDVIQLVDEDVVPEHLKAFKHWQPPFYLRIVTPKVTHIESVALHNLRQLIPKSQLAGGSFDKAWKGSERKLFLRNGSFVLFNTADQDRDAHAGVELHRVHFDEEPEGEHGKGIYTENVARLRRYLPHAQIMFTMTPLFGLSWSYDEVWERREEDGVFCIVASMRDNPFIDAEATIKQLGHLSDAELRAVVEGEFVAFHGMVINVDEKHIVSPLSPSEIQKMDILEVIDPGVARAAVSWHGFDERNRMFTFAELYPQDATVSQMAIDIFKIRKAWGIEPMYTVIDPSARNRVLTNGVNVEGEFAKNGIYTSPGQNERMAGVLQMRGRLEHGGWTISSDCQNILMEARRWIIAEDSENGKGVKFKTKGPDHLMDTCRYACMERLWFGLGSGGPPRPKKIWQPGVSLEELDWTPEINPPPMGSMS